MNLVSILRIQAVDVWDRWQFTSIVNRCKKLSVQWWTQVKEDILFSEAYWTKTSEVHFNLGPSSMTTLSSRYEWFPSFQYSNGALKNNALCTKLYYLKIKEAYPSQIRIQDPRYSCLPCHWLPERVPDHQWTFLHSWGDSWKIIPLCHGTPTWDQRNSAFQI